MKTILLTICMFFYSQRVIAQNAAGEIDGKIITSQGEAVSSAHVYVKLGSKMVGSAMTDTSGVYRVAGLRPGCYTVVAEQKGMIKKTVKQVTVLQVGGIAYEDMQLLYSGGITGTLSSGTGKEIANAFVCVRYNGAKLREGISNSHGEYTIEDLKPGKYELAAAYPGKTTVTKELTIDGQVLQADMQMEQADEPGYKATAAEKPAVVPARNVTDLIGNVVNYGVNSLR